MHDDLEDKSGKRPTRQTGLLRRVLAWAIAVVGGVLVVTTLAGFAGRAAWWLDMTNHFRPQLALALLAVAGLQGVAGLRPLAAAWAVGAAFNVALILPLFVHASAPAVSDRVVVAHLNTGGDAADAGALAAWVSEASPGWLSLQEVTPRNLPRFEAALAGYELATAEPRLDTRGVALFRRLDVVDGSARIVRPTPDRDRPMASFAVDLNGRPVAVLGYHAPRPLPGGPWRAQAKAVDGAVLWAAAQQLTGGEAVLIGDFNATAEGVIVSNLTRDAALIDARRGHGLNGTWPAHLPAFLRVPIDSAYHSAGLTVTHFEVGPDLGSDHRPIAVTFAPR